MLYNSFKRLTLSSAEDNIKVRYSFTKNISCYKRTNIESSCLKRFFKNRWVKCYLVEFLAIDVFSFFGTLRKQPTFCNSITGFPATSSPGCFPPEPRKSALGTRLGFPRNKACDGVAKCRLFSVSSASSLITSPYGHFFLSKKTCRNTIGSPATRNQCESHRAQNSVNMGILFRTSNDSGWGRALHWELFAIWVNPSENFHRGGVPSILNRQIQTESSMRSFS